MDVMNLMEKATTFHHLNGSFTAQPGSCVLPWRRSYSMADSTQQDRILIGIKSKAAPVTVALALSLCQPLCTLDRVRVHVCVCIFSFDANGGCAKSWRFVRVSCPHEWGKRQISGCFKAGPRVCFPRSVEWREVREEASDASRSPAVKYDSQSVYEFTLTSTLQLVLHFIHPKKERVLVQVGGSKLNRCQPEVLTLFLAPLE